MGWIRQQPGVFVLLGALVLGQVVQKVAAPLLVDTGGIGQVPVMAIAVLALAVAFAAVVIVLRVRLGATLREAANVRLEVPRSLPARYVIAAPGAQLVSALLAIVDLALLLLLQNTLRGALLALVDHYQLLQRNTAQMVYVGVVVLIALLLMVRVFRVAGPVVVLLLWWGMERVVPTVGFAGARPEVVSARGTTVMPMSRRQTAAPAPLAQAPQAEATVAAAAAHTSEDEATLVAEKTVISTTRRTSAEEGERA